MRTSKPIATISYNTEDFLDRTLRGLYQRHVISDFMYIRHIHEADELKDHFHVYINPNKPVDTMALQDMFLEIDPNNEKPFKCINFVSSKIDDWILYCLHFKPYLKSKCLEREYSYSPEDIHCADEDTLAENLRHALEQSDFALSRKRSKAIRTINPVDLIDTGVIPLNNAKDLVFYDRLCAQFRRQGLVSDSFSGQVEVENVSRETISTRFTPEEVDRLKPFKQLKLGVDTPFDM